MLKINDLLHRKNDFVGVVTDVNGLYVYVAYYKWMPYDNPDNKTGGMSGWYLNERMEEFLSFDGDPIWKTLKGFPPEYVPAGHELVDEDVQRIVVESRVRHFAKDIAVAAYLEHEEDEVDLIQGLVDYVLGLL